MKIGYTVFKVFKSARLQGETLYRRSPYRLFSRQIIKGISRFLSCSRRGTKSSYKPGLVGILLEEQGFKIFVDT